MFVRSTEQARRVVELANEEAGAAGQDYVGTEHLLLGLLREPDGVAGQVLAGLGVTVEDVRSRAGEVRPPRDPVGRGVMLSAPRTKRVLELADEVASERGEGEVGTIP